MEPVLEVRSLTVRYGSGRGIRDIDLTVRRGDVVGLFGPNGAGKTTLLKTIAGLIRPDNGEVRLFGRDSAADFERAMARVGFVVESADAYDYLSAYDNLKLAARLYPGLAKHRADEVLEQTGLAPYRNEQAGGFSLGMKQRLALAAALLPEPELLVLDEPGNGLDIEGMLAFRRTVEMLSRERQTAFLLSSHLLKDMEPLVSHIGILQDGRLTGFGGRDELELASVTLEQFYLAHMRMKEAAG